MVDVGQQAPEFTLTDTNNQEVHLSSFRGKAVVIAFFPKAFTGTCERQLSDHQHHLSEFEALNAQVIAISTDQGPSQKAFAGNCSITYPVLSDFRHKVITQFGINRETGLVANERAVFIIDKDGKLAWKHIEAAPGQWSGVAPELEALKKL